MVVNGVNRIILAVRDLDKAKRYDARGDTILNVVFNVDDADAGLARAKQQGIQTTNAVDYTQDEIDRHLAGRFARYKEYFLNTGEQCGYGITLGQFEAKKG